MDKIYSYKKEGTAENFKLKVMRGEGRIPEKYENITIPEVKEGAEVTEYNKILKDLIATVGESDKVFVDITGMPSPLVICVLSMLNYGYLLNGNRGYNIESIVCDGEEVSGLFYSNSLIIQLVTKSPEKNVQRILELLFELND